MCVLYEQCEAMDAKKGDAGGGGVKSLFSRKAGGGGGKKKRSRGSSKKGNKGSTRVLPAPAAAPASAGPDEGEGNGPVGGAYNPILQGGKLSPHFQLPLDSRGAYLVLPAEQLEASFDDATGNRDGSKGGALSALTDPRALFQGAGRVAAVVESVPLVAGTFAVMCAGAVAGFLGYSKRA